MIKLFGIRDIKANCFLVVFTAVSVPAALRMFATSVNDSASEWGKFPADFSLHSLGEMDSKSGEVVSKVDQLAVASDVKDRPRSVVEPALPLNGASQEG